MASVRHLDEFDGKKLKSTTEDGFDVTDEDEKEKIEGLEAEFESLTKLMKKEFGEKVEKWSLAHGWPARRAF